MILQIILFNFETQLITHPLYINRKQIIQFSHIQKNDYLCAAKYISKVSKFRKINVLSPQFH